ncbi:Hypothetical predicted protein, partial [Paramuricea clavata]
SMAELMSEEGRNFTRKPIGERWPPLGAPSSELAQETSERTRSESELLKKLEEEHEQLNSSLLALTTHFAQVQFRLKQVVGAPKSDQENLLQSLEKFAFEGIPDVDGAKPVTKLRKKSTVKGYEKRLQDQKQKQEKLITQLRKQLEEMEAAVVKGASETTDSPQKLIEKQKLLLSQLSSHEKGAGSSRRHRDEISDKIPKEQVIKQITKQIMDLEKFIKLLQ